MNKRRSSQIPASADSRPGFAAEEFADKIRWHPESVRLACREGRIRAVKTGPKWLIPATELDRVRERGIAPVSK
jgi:hypothetical protein